jgi:hypothetical protein
MQIKYRKSNDKRHCEKQKICQADQAQFKCSKFSEGASVQGQEKTKV